MHYYVFAVCTLYVAYYGTIIIIIIIIRAHFSVTSIWEAILVTQKWARS